MMKKFVAVILPIFLVYSCSIISMGKQRVYYNEMSKHPEVKVFDEKITLKTSNSNRNSALSIYKIKSNIDTSLKEIELYGFQAAGKKYNDEFDVKLKGLSYQQ